MGAKSPFIFTSALGDLMNVKMLWAKFSFFDKSALLLPLLIDMNLSTTTQNAWMDMT
jgi:hypothetical protein